MKISSIPLAQQIVAACKVKKIKHIVISPGSRNAPLTVSFYSDPFFQCYSIVDERCAGFFALGMAQQLREPVVVLCTSGSAILNYYPALSEAFYSNIPLVIISADRPEHKIDIGDGQTIRQRNVFAAHSFFNANLSEDIVQKKYNNYLTQRALCISFEKQGPVHINAPFEEPLYQTQEKKVETEEILFERENLVSWDKTVFWEHWKSSSKKMVLVGSLFPDSLKKNHWEALTGDPNVLVLTETLSNLHHENSIASIDAFLTCIESGVLKEEELQPDFLLTFGGMIVSKKIKQFLRKNPPKYHYHIGEHKGYDTYFCLTQHLKLSLNEVFEQIPFISNESRSYAFLGMSKYKKIKALHQKFIHQVPYSDMKVYSLIFSYLPNDIQLQLSNSSTIRYAQLFSMNPSWRSFCNRGTSGIDGSTSTALGASVVSERPTVFLTGDLSFFYDSNALWNTYVPSDFKIVLINNDGGGIFRILPGDKGETKFERFFETPHGLTAEHLCRMYNWNYETASDEVSLQNKLSVFFTRSSSRPCLLEIFTPRTENDKVLHSYFSFLRTHI